MKKSLTVTDERELKNVQRVTGNIWRNYWIHVLHRHGYSNAEIAKECEVSELTVRNNLKLRVVDTTKPKKKEQ